MLLKPTNPQPIKWFRPCWKACWSRFLPHWLPWLQACHSSHCWYFWYLSITSKIYLCILLVWYSACFVHYMIWLIFLLQFWLVVVFLIQWVVGYWLSGCVYWIIDGCLCICLIDLFHGISFWHFCFCLAMQDMKHPFWGMTSFATADFLVLLSVIDNFSESFFLEFEPNWLNLSTCWMLIKHVNLNSYNH